MIEVKLSTIIASGEVLQLLSNSHIKGRASYKVMKLLKRADEEFALFNDARKKLIDQYCARDENGNLSITEGNYNIIPEKIEEFNKEIDNLMSTKVHIDIDKIKLSEIEDVDITPQQMLLIEEFIEE